MTSLGVSEFCGFFDLKARARLGNQMRDLVTVDPFNRCARRDREFVRREREITDRDLDSLSISRRGGGYQLRFGRVAPIGEREQRECAHGDKGCDARENAAPARGASCRHLAKYI